MKKVYFISGLGADGRSFGFLDLSFCQPTFIEWAKPSPTDTIATYADKIFKAIGDEEATIVGLSFGGMIATEIAKKHPKTKVIIVASCKTFKEIPAYLRFWRYLPVYKLHSNKMKSYGGEIVYKVIGTRGIEQRKVQEAILRDSDPEFTKWAVHSILTWDNLTVPPNVTHIHGTADRLLPNRYVKADYTIKNGQHVMIMNEYEEVSQLLNKLIAG